MHVSRKTFSVVRCDGFSAISTVYGVYRQAANSGHKKSAPVHLGIHLARRLRQIGMKNTVLQHQKELAEPSGVLLVRGGW
jgi:hypothetical protein